MAMIELSIGSAGAPAAHALAAKPAVAPAPILVPISDVPAMPEVTFNFNILPASPLNAKAHCNWVLKLTFSGSETPHGKAGSELEIKKSTSTPQLRMGVNDWGSLRGGQLSIFVSAVVGGRVVTGRLSGVNIVGTNPGDAALRTALQVDPVRRIARQESRWRQFGADRWPLFSADNKGGAGLGQITPASEDQRWNWRVNCAAAFAKYNDCLRLTKVYQASVKSSSELAAFTKAINLARAVKHLKPVRINVPDWTTDQCIRDAIRGYNGWAGSDPFCRSLHLHEYRLALDATKKPRLTVDERTAVATAAWETVLAGDRPRIGDPDYVVHVMAQQP